MARLAALLLALLALLAALAPAAARAQVPATRKVESRHALSATGMVRLWNPTGSVRVSGWDRDSVAITGAIPAGEEFRCGGSPAGVKCAVDVAARDEGKVGASVLEVRVPRRSQLWIKTAGADVTVTGFRGDLDVYSVTGAINVDVDSRTINLESMGGSIRVRGSAFSLRARTASGSVTLVGVAEDASVSTVGGPIAVTSGALRRGRFESIDGGILWEGAVPRGASLEFSTHSGPIELRLPPETAGAFTVSAFQGPVHSDFGRAPTRRRGVAGIQYSFARTPTDAARVSLRSFKGAILLVKR